MWLLWISKPGGDTRKRIVTLIGHGIYTEERASRMFGEMAVENLRRRSKRVEHYKRLAPAGHLSGKTR